jgi:hypothetical protein
VPLHFQHLTVTVASLMVCFFHLIELLEQT